MLPSYFRHIMVKKEVCAGIVPIRRHPSKGWMMLLILHAKGDYWAFPKGHIHEKEDVVLAAKRELEEETNLRVSSLYKYPMLIENYQFSSQGQLIHKFITYLIALVDGDEKILQPNEVKELKWFTLDQVQNQITFKNSREMIEPLIHHLKSL